MNTENERVSVAVLRALLVGIASALPVFLYLYLEEPRFRWAVDAWVEERTYQLRERRWWRSWSRLPGWRQEIINAHEAPPLELQVRQRPDLFLRLILDPDLPSLGG